MSEKSFWGLPAISETDDIRNAYKLFGLLMICFLFGVFLGGLYFGDNTLKLTLSGFISGTFTIVLIYFSIVQTQINERNRIDNSNQLRVNALISALENVYGPLYYLLHDEDRVDSKTGDYILSMGDLDTINKIFTKFSYVFPSDTYQLWYASIRNLKPVIRSGNADILLLHNYRTRLIQEYIQIKSEYDELTGRVWTSNTE